MLSPFYEKYYGQTPDATAFIQHPSDRTAPPLRDRCPSQAPAPCTDRLARPSGAFCRRDRRDCAPPSRDTVERVLKTVGAPLSHHTRHPAWLPP